ncbi:Zinc finger C2HC domain-containing protein 1C [Nymphon striatum]|nr:Zinc finger C2HC domain-containing protein 1C [Nymphon striatum]
MTSRLQQMQQSYQKRQMQEKEKHLVGMYADNQQRALDKVSRSGGTDSNRETNKFSSYKSFTSNSTSVNKRSPGIDKSRPLAPLNNNVQKTSSLSVPTKPKIKVTLPTPKSNVLSDRQKARDDMKKKEAELLSKIKQQKAELDKVKQKKSKNLVSENNERNRLQPQNRSKPKPLKEFNSNSSQIENNPKPSKPSLFVAKHQKQQPAPKKAPVDPNLTPCKICGRSFAKDRIDKHVGICKSTTQKKRKVFDITKMRTQGTEAEKYVRKGLHKKAVPTKKSNWRKKHEDFMKTVAAAKQISQLQAAGVKLSDLPPPPPSDNSDYVQCPHCNRKFSDRAADRHIPMCENILSNKSNSSKNQWNTSKKPALANRIAARRR